MRMAHLYPIRLPSHHEIHLREEEAEALTTELLGSLPEDIWKCQETHPTLWKVFRLLGARNTHADRVEKGVAHSYFSHRSLD